MAIQLGSWERVNKQKYSNCTYVFLGGFRLQIDDICIAPAIIDLFYFIIFNVFSSTGHFYYVTIMACFCYFLCANIEHLAKSVYDFTNSTQVILKSI